MGRAILYVAKAASRIESAAKAMAPVRKPNENNRPGGRLRASIGTKMVVRTTTVTARVGSRVRYALVVHTGADFHVIRPRKKRMLSFKWKKAPAHLVTQRGRHRGRVLLARVNHPGMRGVPYLTDPLKVTGPGMGFRVVTRALWR
jgi:hypothetical protein